MLQGDYSSQEYLLTLTYLHTDLQENSLITLMLRGDYSSQEYLLILTYLHTDLQENSLITLMLQGDYSSQEYDFFFRNCNHFCDDLSQASHTHQP